MNHEAITPPFLHPTGQTVTGTDAAVRTVADEVLREFYLHGVSVIEVSKGAQRPGATSRTRTLQPPRHTLTRDGALGPGGAAPTS